MGSFTIEVKGADKLITKFENMSREMENEVKNSVKKHTLEMEAKAKKFAPYLSGHLKRSIHSSFYNRGLSGEISTNVKYSVYQEFGTRYMAAQPFFFPAFLTTRSNFIRDLNRIMKDVVD